MRYWLIKKRGKQSQKTIAAKCGISQNYLSSIENGIRHPSVKVAKSIAEVLGFNWTKFYQDK